MNAAGLGIQLRDARRANEETKRANEEQRRQWMLENGAVEDGSGGYAYGQGSEGALDNQVRSVIFDANNNDINQARREKAQNLEIQQDRALQADGHPVYGASDNPEQQQIEMQKQQLAAQGQQIQQIEGQMSIAASDNALLDFMEHGDANSIQQSLKNNPILGEAWAGQGGQHVSNIDLVNDAHLLDSIGFTQEHMAYEELRNLVKKNIYKVWDGEKYVAASAEQLAKETGVLGRVTPNVAATVLRRLGEFHAAKNGVMADLERKKAETVDRQLTHDENELRIGNENTDDATALAKDRLTHDQDALKVGNENTDDATALAKDRLTHDQDALKVGNENTDNATALAKDRLTHDQDALKVGNENTDDATALARDQLTHDENELRIGNENTDDATALAKNQLTHEEKELQQRIDEYEHEKTNPPASTTVGTAKARNLADANAARVAVVEDLGGGSEKYFSTIWDRSQPNFIKMEEQLKGAEFLTDSEMSEEDKRIASNLNKVNILGKEAAKLGKAHTGFISAPLDSLGRYTIDQINGLQKVAAWNLLNTVLLRAEGGKVLSASEIELHKESHGSLLEQWGPLMVGLRQSLVGNLAAVDSLIESRGKITGWFYHGKTREGIAKTIALIDTLTKGEDQILEKNEPVAPDVKLAGGGNRGVSDSSLTSILAQAKAK